MRISEILWKTIAFGFVGLVLIGAGVVVLFYGNHPYNDYLNMPLAVLLILIGLATWGVGALIIAGNLRDARLRRKEADLHITPRGGPPALPPAWGMGDVGRPGSGVVHVGEGGGGGQAKVVRFSIVQLDGPIIIGALIVWTLVACLLAAHALTQP